MAIHRRDFAVDGQEASTLHESQTRVEFAAFAKHQSDNLSEQHRHFRRIGVYHVGTIATGVAIN